MPTTCSATRKRDKTVGKSSKRTRRTRWARDLGHFDNLHGEQEIQDPQGVRHAAHCTGRSRICTNGQTEPRSSMTCRSTRSCRPATSGRGAGRPPWGRGAPGTWPCSTSRASLPRPCRLLALCAMVRGFGKGHGDAHPFMPQHGTEASLSPAAGTPREAAASRSTSTVNR